MGKKDYEVDLRAEMDRIKVERLMHLRVITFIANSVVMVSRAFSKHLISVVVVALLTKDGKALSNHGETVIAALVPAVSKDAVHAITKIRAVVKDVVSVVVSIFMRSIITTLLELVRVVDYLEMSSVFHNNLLLPVEEGVLNQVFLGVHEMQIDVVKEGVSEVCKLPNKDQVMEMSVLDFNTQENREVNWRMFAMRSVNNLIVNAVKDVVVIEVVHCYSENGVNHFIIDRLSLISTR